MNEQGKGLAFVVLGVVAVIAIVGLVLLFSKANAAGNFVYTGQFAQYTPQEACDQVGCPLSEIIGGMGFTTTVAAQAVCSCPDRDVLVPLVQRYDWRSQYYPQHPEE
jgi:hypothetical protein